jgi:Cof subfamily protein (haloacid dehalogenase superfamily)
MVRSVRRALEPAGLHDPLICYQGAVAVDGDGTWIRHTPIPLPLARDVIAFAAAEGYSPNVYVGDELFVAEVTQHARDYAEFQHLEIQPVGDLLAWLVEPPTKLVLVGDPDALDAVESRAKAQFGPKLYISKSLPYFLEFAAAGVTKGTGLDFLANRIGFTRDQTISFGDGENDVELVEWAGYGIAVENAHERVKAVADWICPSAQVEGVAQVLELFLDSKR